VLQLAKPGDSGKPLVIRGRVVDVRGNPLPGVSVRVYHADLHGEYGKYDGTLTTGPNGTYEVRTIRPGSYGGYAAHVHYVVTRGSSKAYFQLLFADDVRKREPAEKQFPVLPDSLLRQWNAPNHGLHTEEVRPVTVGPDGVHRVERDLQLR
jgi:protocatechuate 3,4-dioxygenase beta subunit